MYRRALCLALLALLPSCRPIDALSPGESAAVDRVLDRVSDRLALMPDVAKAKWNDKLPISDPDRETQLLLAVARRAREKGIDERFARAVVAAQITAARLAQQKLFDRWKADNHGRFDEVAPLAAQRQKIDAATNALLDAAADLRPMLAHARVRQAIEERAKTRLTGFDAEVRAAALEPLLSS